MSTKTLKGNISKIRLQETGISISVSVFKNSKTNKRDGEDIYRRHK
jgi:hypothetical protein